MSKELKAEEIVGIITEIFGQFDPDVLQFFENKINGKQSCAPEKKEKNE